MPRRHYTRRMRFSSILPTRFFGSTAFTAVGKRIFPRADKALHHLTHGRGSLSGVVGQPSLLLETTGRRTGQTRVTPLTFAMWDMDFVVVGSNWGQASHPCWALNLRDNPDAVVDLHGVRIPVTGYVLRGAERADAWQRMLKIWPAYDEYAARVQATSSRPILVFRLERK